MTQILTSWKVLPHGELTQVDDGVLTVVGQIVMPLTKFPRRMTVVRLRGARTLIFNGIALDEAEMARIEALGQPVFMIVPNDHHRLDSRIYKERYPSLAVVAPAGALAKVAKIVPVDTSAPDFGDHSVRFVAVPGTREQEAALVIDRDGRTTLVVNDIIGNIHDAHGVGGWLLELIGFAGDEPRIPGVAKMALVKDRAGLRSQLLDWAALPSLA